jgi:hypothetical protein
MGQDLEGNKDVPLSLSLNIAPYFAHHDGDEVLNFHGTN